MFAVLLNLMTNQSYAQVTIACNTVESPVLQGTLRGMSGEYVPFPGLAQSNLAMHVKKNVKGVNIEFVKKKEAQNVLEESFQNFDSN